MLVGDPDLTDASWERFAQVSAGFVELRCELEEGYGYLCGQVHHDRPDSSAQIIRSQESRTSLKPARSIKPDAHAGDERAAGSIAVSNSAYLRYEGELEIARVDVPGDARMNVVGAVCAEDKRFLPYVRDGFGFKLV